MINELLFLRSTLWMPRGVCVVNPPLWYNGDVPRMYGSSVYGEGSGSLLPVLYQYGVGRGKRDTEYDEGMEVHLPIEM